jgi:colicin import membrane protein
MPHAFDRIEFTPPAQPGMLRAMGLAILAHLLLAAALTWGVNWKSQDSTLGTAQAELWSSVPQQAAVHTTARA